MDHIIGLPSDPAHDPVTVEYVPGIKYDGQGLSGFAARNGFDIDKLINGDYEGKTDRDAQSLMQAWLFFGPLCEFFGCQIDPLEFTCEDVGFSSGLRLRTYGLAERLAQFKESKFNSLEGVQESAGRIMDCLSNLSSATQDEEVAALMGPELHLVVCVLGSTLDKARTAVKIGTLEEPESVWHTDKRQHDLYLRFGPSPLLRDRLSLSGWCPSQIPLIEAELTPAAIYYASMLKRPVEGFNHKGCSEKQCIQNQIDESKYQTQHTAVNCDCRHHGPDVARIAEIIEEGGVPVIGIKPQEGGKAAQMRVVYGDVSTRGSDHRPYVAISHVWRDGLGNAAGNSLPNCQIQKLYNLVKKVYHRIDTSHDEFLRDKTQMTGDDKTSEDDQTFTFKSVLLWSQMSRAGAIGESWKSQSNNSRALESDSNNNAQSHAGENVPEVKREELKGPKNALMFPVMDCESRDFLPRHGISGDNNADWKAFDAKDLTLVEDTLRDERGEDEIFLWLDTFCIPKREKYRDMAIQSMRNIYANAAKVLVLDSELQQMSASTSHEEVLTRINLSAWMQRAWTLEEAAVGGVLLFQFADGVFNLWRFARTWFRRSTQSLVLSDATRPWVKIRQLQQPRHHTQQMQWAHDTLENRITSKRPDLNIIFSTLMGIDTKTVLSTKEGWPVRARIFSGIWERCRTGFFWVPDEKPERNYLPVSISVKDQLSNQIYTSRDADGNVEYFKQLKWLEENVPSYREAPGYVLRCPSFIASLTERTGYSDFFAFRVEPTMIGVHVTLDDKSNDIPPRQPDDESIILTPYHMPTMPREIKPGILVTFTLRANLGGTSMTRVGANFASFISRVSIRLMDFDTDTAALELLMAGGTPGKMAEKMHELNVTIATIQELQRNDTMWCIN